MTPTTIWEVTAGSPAWVHAVVLLAVTLHIGGGGLAILAGYAAGFAPKGGKLHRVAGKAFVAAMFVMAVAAVSIACAIPQRGNVAAGILALYLAATGWAAVKRRAGEIGRFETGALIVALAVAAVSLSFGLQASQSGAGKLDGFPAGPFYVLAALALFFAWGDFGMIRRGGLSGAARTARHLGRMCFAFFIAAGSFFIGQQKVMPVGFHGSPALYVLGLAPLGLMIFWLIKVRRKSRPGRPVAAPA